MPKTAAKWISSTADEMAVANGCYFNERAAAHVVEFFAKYLRHSKGQWAGKPFELLDWQRDDVIYPLFGWMRADKTRRYRKSFIEIPKKNGKSTIAAGIGLYLLVADGEAGAEVFSAAADRDQASIVHGEAIHMVEASEALQSVLRINQTTKTITFEKTKSMYRALSSEAESKEGLNASGIIVDELHVWYGRKLWDALKYAGRARSQPLTFVITTAGDDPLSVCREQYDYAKGVLAGTVQDDRFFAYIREAQPDDDWMLPEIWKKANPSLGITINEADFAADMLEASKTPTTQASAKRYSLNIWATATNPWLKMGDWLNCYEPFTLDQLEGQTCYAGLDLAKTRDMTALLLIFRDFEGIYRLVPYFWLPEAAATDPDKPEEYRVWARDKLLELTPGNVCDYAFVSKRIVELKERFDIRELGFDPYNAEQMTQELEANHDLKRVAFPQTIQNFAEPTKEFERLVLSGGLKHNGHPILTWQAGNVSVRTDANGNIRPVKPPQGDPRKIDGMVAAIMALARAMLDTEQPCEAGMFLIGGD